VRILTLRLTISLIVGITLISLLSSYYEVRFQKSGLRRDLEHQAEVLGESLADKVEPYLNSKKASRRELQLTVDRFAKREHLTGVAVYNTEGESLAITHLLALRLTGEPEMVQQAAKQGLSAGVFIRLGEVPV
jgi:trehalose 6-phosphate synthase